MTFRIGSKLVSAVDLSVMVSASTSKLWHLTTTESAFCVTVLVCAGPASLSSNKASSWVIVLVLVNYLTVTTIFVPFSSTVWVTVPNRSLTVRVRPDSLSRSI